MSLLQQHQLRLLTLVLTGMSLFCLFPEHTLSKPAVREVRVIKVHDGDTVTLMLDRRMRKTRLIGIDAPEMNQRPWGRRAKEHLTGIMDRSGWLVSVETDTATYDKFDRPLVYLRTREKEFINEQMVLDGYAVSFTIKPNVMYQEKFMQAELRAKTEKKGIWGPNGLKEAPSTYRRKHPRKELF